MDRLVNVRAVAGCQGLEAEPIVTMPEGVMANVPPHMQMAALLQARHALKLEIKTGLVLSRGRSYLRAVQKTGVTKAKTKKGALKDVNALIAELGGPEDRNPITD